MKLPKLKFSTKVDLNSLPGVQKLHLERVNPLVTIIIGAGLLLTVVVMLFLGGASQQDNVGVLKQAGQTMDQVGDLVLM